ncbi:MAG: zf-TFIIB domain-containing protein [Myxococcota bacterium]
MSRACPICPSQPMRAVSAKDVELDICPRCEGLWFDASELELFPNRPSAKAFLSHARLAPGRCRKNGHRVAKGLLQCQGCGSALACCPSCGQPLAMVGTTQCVLDVCSACEGVWLDKGELEALEGVTGAAPPPSPKANDVWEVPAPAPAAPDPWLAPGQSRPTLSSRHVPNPRSPFSCHHCDEVLSLHQAWAFDGDIYCEACRPGGAVSGKELPKDQPAAQQMEKLERHWGRFRLIGWPLVVIVRALVGL